MDERDKIDYKSLYLFTAAMVIFSLVVYGIVVFFGYHIPKGPAYLPSGAVYDGYLNKPNWYLDPIWFLILALVVYKSWAPFVVAWTTTLENPPVVTTSSGDSPTERSLFELNSDLGRYRNYIYISAILCSLIFNAADIYPMASVYLTSNATEQIQYIKANMHPDFFDKWLYEKPITTEALSPPLSQWLVFGFCYLQQIALVFMGFVVLLQTLFHVFLFWSFPKPLTSAINNKLTINLNCSSIRKDYGLTLWNRALDRLYLFMSLGLLVPITSRLLHGGPPNPGHVIGFTLLFILIIAPGVFSIAARQRWTQKAEDTLKDQPDAILRCQDNAIWPIDKNILSKIWIVVSLSLYSVYLTNQWSAVIDTWINIHK